VKLAVAATDFFKSGLDRDRSIRSKFPLDKFYQIGYIRIRFNSSLERDI
jgi:hypothetical protein